MDHAEAEPAQPADRDPLGLPWVPVQSSNLARVAYLPARRTMFIQFLRSGNCYRYERISPFVHQGIMTSGSKGTRFHYHVRSHPDQYPYFGPFAADDPELLGRGHGE